MTNTPNETTRAPGVWYRGFRIVPKLDFGGRPFLIDGEYVSSGFVVVGPSTLEGIEYVTGNVMPGATWATTVDRARALVDDYFTAGLNAIDHKDSPEMRAAVAKFWELVRARAANKPECRVPKSLAEWTDAHEMPAPPRLHSFFKRDGHFSPTYDGSFYLASIIAGADAKKTAVIYCTTAPQFTHHETGEMYFVVREDDPTRHDLSPEWEETASVTLRMR